MTTYNEARSENLMNKEAAYAEAQIARLTKMLKTARANGWDEMAGRYEARIKAI